MQFDRRSLFLTAAFLLASAAGLLLTAAPQQKPPAGESTPSSAAGSASVARPEAAVPKGSEPAIAPVSFADPDGQELLLEELSVRTAIQGMLSLTELEFRFRNPTDRRIEGRFSCTLPPNAAISRFAKDVNGQLMEGEVVERLRANQIYEQFLHQMRDPAFLEQDQGNRFSARIFPIEPHAPVHLVLSYSALLPMKDGVRTYTLPLRGIQKVNKLTFKAFVSALPDEEATDGAKSSGISGISGATRSTSEVIGFEERDKAPERDIVLSWRPTSAAARARVLRAGDFYLSAFRPAVREEQTVAPSSWRIYVDTSASAAEGASHRIRALEEMIGALPPSDRVELVAFDQEIVTLGSGTAAELSRTAGELLRNRLFLGGTDLHALVRAVARAAQEQPSRGIVVASDFVATLGQTEARQIHEAIGNVPPRTVVHALILGSREEAATAKALVARRGRVIRIPFSETLTERAREAAGELRRPLGSSIDVTDSNAEWVYPMHFDDVAAGDEIVVLGKLKAGAEPAAQMSGHAEQVRSTALAAGTFGPLLEREAYRAYLEYLAEREAAEPSEAVRRALGTEQVRISIEQRVVVPRTTMLVLESEWDYQRFGLDRRALAAILTVEGGSIGRIDRRNPEWLSRNRPIPMPVAPPVLQRQRGEREKAAQGTVLGVGASAPASAPPPVMAPADAAADLSGRAVAEAITVSAEAPEQVAGSVSTTIRPNEMPTIVPRPRSRPAPPPPPVPPARVAKDTDSSWTEVERPTRKRIDELQERLRENPRDRELYNQLSEALVAHGEWRDLRSLALQWQPYDPENPQVYEILGTAGDHLGNASEAARAYASLIEIAPAKTELLQRAGLLLIRANRAALAEAPLRKALEVRPDRANGYRHLALMLWREGRLEEAARVLESATRQQFPVWYGNVQRVIREELGYVYRAWMAKEPALRADIEQRARDFSVDLAQRDALRITLAWETDANDVDLHVIDPDGEECSYNQKATRSGLELYQDITQGLGPEVIRTSRVERGTYHVGVRYFSAGPMGVSRGIVVVMRNDDVEIHPFRLVQGGREVRYVTGVKVK